MEPINILLTELEEMARGFIERLPELAIAMVILLLVWGLTKIVDRMLRTLLSKAGLRKTLVVFYRKAASIILWITGAVIATVVVFPSVTPAKMLTAVGLGSVAIGFAFKDIFENFLAGMLILLREPFQIGDFIECEGANGFVERVTIRDTLIRRTDGQAIVVPNAQIFKNAVKVRTDLDRLRIRLICGVAYGEDLDEAREVIRKAVESVDSVDKEKEVQIFANEFADSSINFEITWWTKSSPVAARRSRDEVISAVKRALDDADIEIPFPYRTLTFQRESFPVEVSKLKEARG